MRTAVLCILVLGAVTMAACGQPFTATYIPEGGSYTADDLTALLSSADTAAAADIEPEDVAEERQRILADLRQNGEEVAALANVLTQEFPPDLHAVPVLVERCTYDAEPAWVVVEAWGDQGQPLAFRRLWVFSYGTNAVLAAQSTR